jgi:hypothetical protein
VEGGAKSLARLSAWVPFESRQIVNSDGRLWSLFNGAAVATEAEAPFPNGVHLWELGLELFVSSFNSTIGLDGEFNPQVLT